MSALYVVVLRRDGRKLIIPGREAVMVEMLADRCERIARERHGEWRLRFRDSKLTPSLELTEASVNCADARERSPSELEALRRMDGRIGDAA